MGKYLNKKTLFIGAFSILYMAVAIVSLIHSFSFFGLANGTAMAVMLGCAFELGQFAVLMSIMTQKKAKAMPWVLMCILTLVQILGNVFSSYKYLITHSSENLRYFKEPIFVWTDLPDNITTVIITYLVGGILPLVALCMTAMVETFLEDEEQNNQPQPAPVPAPVPVQEQPKVIEQEQPKVIEQEEKVTEQPQEIVTEPVEEPVAEDEQPSEETPVEEVHEEVPPAYPKVTEQLVVEENKPKHSSGFINL